METWLIILLAVIWYGSGIFGMAWLILDEKPSHYKEITLADMITIIGLGSMGLLAFAVFLYTIGEDITIWKQSK